jgi:hypothetical protein
MLTGVVLVIVIGMARWAAGASCNSTSMAALASCEATFTECVDTEAKGVCDCNIDRLDCGNEVGACDEADAQVLAWSTSCKGAPDCEVYCPQTRFEKQCDDVYDVAYELKSNCTEGLGPNVTLCACWSEWNATLSSHLAQCPSFQEHVDEFARDKDLLCTASIGSACTPYENRLVETWSSALTQCTDKAKNGTVTMVGAVCRCLREYKMQRTQLGATCASLVGALQPIAVSEQLHNCEVNIDKDTVCDTRDTDACSAALVRCATAAASVVVPTVATCSCYSDASKCIAKHPNCPAGVVLAGTFHAVCTGTCPATVDCGPMPKQITLVPGGETTTAPAVVRTDAAGNTISAESSAATPTASIAAAVYFLLVVTMDFN